MGLAQLYDYERGCMLSTNSAIARPRGDGWEGIYCHWSGEPTTRGRQVWELVHAKFDGNGEAFLKEYLDKHPFGWSSFPKSCYCHDPKLAAPDNAPMPVTSADERTTRPLFIEWVYIVAPRVMTILKGIPLPGANEYTWVFVQQVEFSDVDPDWAAIKKHGEDIGHVAWERNRPSDAA